MTILPKSFAQINVGLLQKEFEQYYRNCQEFQMHTMMSHQQDQMPDNLLPIHT